MGSASEFHRLPEALLHAHILSQSSAFAIGQAAKHCRELVYGSESNLWRTLDMNEFFRDREAFRQNGSEEDRKGSSGMHASLEELSMGAWRQEEEQLTLLLLRLVPPLTSSFRGAATDAVLDSLRLKFSKVLQAVQIQRRSRINPGALLSLAESMGSGLKVLQLSCAFELQPGFLSAVASSCPNLTELSFSPHTMVLPMADRWQADPGMMRSHPDNKRQLQEQRHRHAFTLELFQLLASCPGLGVLYLPPGMHVCNGVLLAVRRWSQRLQRLHGARVNFLSGEGLTWPLEIEEEYCSYLLRKRAAAGLAPLQDQQHVAADSKSLADLTYQTFDDVVQHLSGRAGAAQPGAAVSMSACASSLCSSASSGGWVFIDDIAGRRLRIDMQYNAVWGVN